MGLWSCRQVKSWRAARALRESWLEMQTIRPIPDPLRQNLHFDKSPDDSCVHSGLRTLTQGFNKNINYLLQEKQKTKTTPRYLFFKRTLWREIFITKKWMVEFQASDLLERLWGSYIENSIFSACQIVLQNEVSKKKQEEMLQENRKQGLNCGAHLVEHIPANWKVFGSIPAQGTCLGWGARERYSIDVTHTHWCFSPSLYAPCPLSLKINKNF